MAECFYKKYADLSWFMWVIYTRMAVLYNKMKGTKGHLWVARFKIIVVEPGEHLLRVIAYLEMNAVRAGIVEDPSDFPYSSVGRTKEQLDQGKNPKVPATHLLENIPEEIRAQTYVDFMRYVAVAQTESELRHQLLPILFTSRGIEVNLTAMCGALDSRESGNWSNLTYGLEEFAEKTLIEVGWLVPMKRPGLRRLRLADNPIKK